MVEWKGAKEGEEEEELYMREAKDEEQELREAMAAGKESTVFARVKVPTQVGRVIFILILFLKLIHILYPDPCPGPYPHFSLTFPP